MSGETMGPGSDDCRVRVLTTLAELDPAVDEWQSLWERCTGARSPALSFPWVRAWCEHFVRDGGLHVVLVEREGSTVGIMPLYCARYRIGPFCLEALETIGGESRNLIALVAPGSGEFVARAAAEHLVREVLTWRRELRVALVPSEHGFLGQLRQALERSTPGACVRVRGGPVAPYVLLPAIWEDYERSLGKRRRGVIRRASTDLEHDFRAVSLHRHHGANVSRAMETLFELHQARWREAGVRGLFQDERNRRFHREVAESCDHLGWLDLTSLDIGTRSVSVCFNVVLDGVVYVMRSGRDTSLAAYSVGHVHDIRLFRRWISEGLREVDFLRGAEPYKFYWTRRYRRYVELTAAPAGLWGRVSLSAGRLWMRLSRFVAHRHPPRELRYYFGLRRTIGRELAKMGIRLEP